MTRIFGLLIAIAIPATAWTSPSSAICIVSSFVGNEVSKDGSVRASASYGDIRATQLNEYVLEGRARIKSMLWNSTSEPTIVFLDGKKVFGIFDYNKYGSSIALPGKTCLLIGPKGTNVDVVSHELVHADMAEMLGYWKTFNLPAWINEGVAMQVDLRKRYDFNILDGIDPLHVTSKDGSEFYAGDVADVVQNYASAKYLFGDWIEKNGIDQLQLKLRSMEFNPFEF